MSKYKKGQSYKPTAKELNDNLAATKIVLGGLPGGNVFQGRDLYGQSIAVRVKNTTTANQARFAVLAIDNLVFSLAQNKEATISQPCLSLKSIGGPRERNNTVILQEPLIIGAIGQAVLSGLTPAWVDVRNEAHTHVDVGSSGDAFVSGFHGVGRLITRPTSRTRTLCMVLIGDTTPSILFKVPDDGIPGREDETLGQATVEVCDIKDGEIIPLTSGGGPVTETVFHAGPVIEGEDGQELYGQAKLICNHMMVDVIYCPDEEDWA